MLIGHRVRRDSSKIIDELLGVRATARATRFLSAGGEVHWSLAGASGAGAVVDILVP